MIKRLNSTLEEREYASSNSSLDEVVDVNNELYEYFMNIAILKAKTRHNYKNQAGACIINSDNKIVGIGNYTQEKLRKNDFLSIFKNNFNKSKTDYANHAEMNAIFNRTESSLDNCTLFVTSFPCIECAKMILQSGLKKVVYMADSSCQKLSEQDLLQTKKLFKLSGIECHEFE